MLKVEKASTKGFGLFVKEELKKGDFVIEYVGELISTDEFKKRVALNIQNNKGAEKNCYYMVMDNRYNSLWLILTNILAWKGPLSWLPITALAQLNTIGTCYFPVFLFFLWTLWGIYGHPMFLSLAASL